MHACGARLARRSCTRHFLSQTIPSWYSQEVRIVCRGNIFANYHHLVCEHTPFILHAAFELMK